jgi:molecular chaperone HtpG/TNF receptor-associated protein 1
LPIDEIAPLSLWLKNELAPQVTLVQVSKRLKDTPAIVVSKFTSGMRQVMGMVDKT